MTLLEENEVLCEIHVPAFAAGTGSAYEKLKRKTGDWATAGCAVVMRRQGGVVSELRIALTNVAPTALRAIKQVAVVGGGTMGGGIAMNFANVGIPVLLKEISQEDATRFYEEENFAEVMKKRFG
jgi:carbon-monoxide dehydrogenase medium subunit